MRRLTVLQLACRAPLPPDQGGKIRSFHLLKALLDVADVTMVCFERNAEERRAGEAMADLGVRVTSVPLPLFQANLSHHFRSPRPLLAQGYGQTGLLGATATHLARSAYDVVIVDGFDVLMASVGIEKIRGPRLLYSAHNVESEVYRRCLALERRRLKARLGARLDLWKSERFERDRVRRFSAITAVSTRDADVFRRWAPAASVHVIPNGTDCSYFVPRDGEVERGAIVFTGTLSYAPNRDAVQYFGRHVWPRIRQAIPWATWYIVGREIDEVTRSLVNQPGVVVTGYVDDVRSYLARAQVVAVPLRAGGGTRLKILEALAMARPLVSTSLGAEGLELTPGDHLVIADDAGSFAEAVIALLARPEAGHRLGVEARRAILERYDWRSIARGYVDAVLRLGADLDGHGRDAPPVPYATSGVDADGR